MYTGRCGGWVLQLTHLNGFGDAPSGHDVRDDLHRAKKVHTQLVHTLEY